MPHSRIVIQLHQGTELVGTLVSVLRNKAVIETKRTFEISVDEETARSIKEAVGKRIAILCIEGNTRWRPLGEEANESNFLLRSENK